MLKQIGILSPYFETWLFVKQVQYMIHIQEHINLHLQAHRGTPSLISFAMKMGFTNAMSPYT
jgi:hypothetical protein